MKIVSPFFLSPDKDTSKDTTVSFFVALFGIVLVFAGLRLPYLDVPLERDEGDYATIADGILKGIPPYQDAYSMKWPGGFALYALIFSLLGPSSHSLHLALLFLNSASMILVGVLAKKWLGISAGLFSSAAYGTLTIGLGIFGFWLSAEHFAVLFLLSGVYFMAFAAEHKRVTGWVIGSFLLGMAMVVKQHAALPGLACVLSMVWIQERCVPRFLRKAGVLLIVFMLPLIITSFMMMKCGVFHAFNFWTFTYASQYISGVPFFTGWTYFKIGTSKVFSDAPVLWGMAGLGIILLLKRCSVGPHSFLLRTFLIPTSLAACLAASAGLMFRSQYFILITPFAALLTGVVWQWMIERVSFPLVKAIAGGTIVAAFLVLCEPLFFIPREPTRVSRLVFGMNPFPEYPIIADYVRRHSTPEEPVLILGSEPGIYFLSNRRPAMPHICTYEMMKPHSFAVEMQNEAIQAIEKNKPSCIVFVNLPTSWGLDLKPELPFFQWLRSYLATNYVVDGIVDLVSEERTIYKWGEEVRSYQPESPYTMWLFLRKDRESVRD